MGVMLAVSGRLVAQVRRWRRANSPASRRGSGVGSARCGAGWTLVRPRSGESGGQGLGGEDVETALEIGPGAGDGGAHDGVVSAEERG